MKLLHLLAAAAVLAVGCQSNSETESSDQTSSGIRYQIVASEERGDALQVGDIVNIHMEAWIGDSMIYSTRRLEKLPVPFEIVEPVEGAPFDMNEIYLQAHEYDSIVAFIPLDSMPQQAAFYRQIDSTADHLEVRVQLLGKYDEEKIITAYIDSMQYGNLPSKTTPNGVRVYWKEQGNGPEVKVGDSLTLHVVGRVVRSGLVFFNTRKDEFPLGLVFDSTSVYPGLFEGLLLLRAGDKAVLILPSRTALGALGQPLAGIPPFAPIEFEVEVVAVTPHEHP